MLGYVGMSMLYVCIYLDMPVCACLRILVCMHVCECECVRAFICLRTCGFHFTANPYILKPFASFITLKQNTPFIKYQIIMYSVNN